MQIIQIEVRFIIIILIINLDFLASKASLNLQIFIYFERIYIVIFFFFEIILYVFKANVLVYPPNNLGPEIVGLFFLLILQYVKLQNANTANKTEIRFYHIYTILYSIPVLMGYCFYLRHQVYCLSFDIALCGFGIFFAFLELLFSFVALFNIKEG